MYKEEQEIVACFFGDGALQDFVEVLLINGYFAGLELLDALFVDVGAVHFMAGGRQASASYKSNIPTPNHGQPHDEFSLS